jgi:hypothetical protein
MKPILSRFCEIYVPEPIINGVPVNLYKYNLNETFKMREIHLQEIEGLKKELIKCSNKNNKIHDLMNLATKLYEKGYSGLDILYLLENTNFLETTIDIEKRYELLICFNKIKKEIRNEKLIMLFILNFVFLSLKISLENISFM